MNAETMRLFHVSDLHFGMEDRNALDWFAARVAAERPDGVVVSGDLTMRARHSEFEAACRWLSALDAPVFLGIGNHDLPYFNPIERFAAPYRRFRKLAEAVAHDVLLDDLAIVFLKTTARAQWLRLNWSKGRITRAALQRTLTEIDTTARGHRVIVCAHHPLVEAGTQGTALTTGGPQAMEALARRGVLAVLSGHVHDPFDREVETTSGTIRTIGAGTLSERIRETPPSFNEIRLDGTAITTIVRTMDDR